MTPLREAYLTADESAVRLLGDEAVASSWSAASALDRLSVGGLAAEGAAAIAERAAARLGQLRERLAAEPVERVVRPPAGPWGLLLDDVLITRMMEIVVHCDDLVVSVGHQDPSRPSDG